MPEPKNTMMMAPLRRPSSGLVPLLCLLNAAGSAVVAQSCGGGGLGGGGDGTCPARAKDQYECGLYMAPSTIPNSGWGVFTGIDRKSEKSIKDDEHAYIEPYDVSIPVIDYEYQMIFDEKDKKLPEWLLKDYDWTSFVAQVVYDADHVVAITPGLGMLANSHTVLFNLENVGCLVRERVSRNSTEAGAFTHCQEHVFAALEDIGAGSELFGEYGTWCRKSWENSFTFTHFLILPFFQATSGSRIVPSRLAWCLSATISPGLITFWTGGHPLFRLV